MVGEFLCSHFHIGEDEGFLVGAAAQYGAHRLHLILLTRADLERLLDVEVEGDLAIADLNVLWVVVHVLRKYLLNLLLPGGCEQCGLPVLRQSLGYFDYLLFIAHLQNAVGLIQSQILHTVERELTVIQEIEQPAWSCHHHVASISKPHQLSKSFVPATHCLDLQIQSVADPFEVVLDLSCQLPGRRKNQVRRPLFNMLLRQAFLLDPHYSRQAVSQCLP